MTASVWEMQQQILRLKKEQDVCILAHSYLTRDIVEVADYTGDSYMLSVKAAGAPQKNILMCGVRFMAETAKILSPDKRVYLANGEAGCPMAEQFTAEEILREKEKHPGCAVVAYVNTTAAIKAVSDVCVTSSSAVKIVRNLPAKDILFIPDCNLGAYVAQAVPEKTFHFMKGGCPIHSAITGEEAKKAKEVHPNALFLVHPECVREVTEQADFVGSTAEIMQFVQSTDKQEFIIGTENNIAAHLQYLCPDKTFYLLSKKLICPDMRSVTLPDLLACLQGRGGEEILMTEKEIEDAGKSILEMIRLGK